MEIVWIYYGFSGSIANIIVWIFTYFPIDRNRYSTFVQRLLIPEIAKPGVKEL
jgi:hypothetical protein